ncbi:radical SAM protein [Streptomyces sp. NPDC101175]|uniref:radical SAM protein n=1 Tax=Streptomyces sp. NPDC101175 TaxID=3366123 RepID=UPI003835139B
MAVVTEASIHKGTRAPGLVWLDLTRKCQLACGHCHNGSGPDGTHGSMTTEDWTRVLDEAAGAGVSRVQFTGGEVTLHPDAPALVEYALKLGLAVEVYSNMVHLNGSWWSLLRREHVSLATSYYGREDAHNAVTGRNSHARTRANIVKAVAEDIPIRVSVIVSDPSDTGEEVKRELAALGVRNVRVDHVRPFGPGGRTGRNRARTGCAGDAGTGASASVRTGRSPRACSPRG